MNLKIRKFLLKNYIYYIIFLLSIILSLVYLSLHNSKYSLEDANVKGVVSSYKIDGNLLTLVVNDRENIRCSYYLKTEEEKLYYTNALKYGIEVNLTGQIKKPMNNTIPNTFNYKKYLSSIGIFYTFTIESIEITNHQESFFYQVKNIIQKRINSFVTADYINTFIIGKMDLIDENVLSSYQINGTTHLFSLSGMHVSFFSLIILFILKKCKVKEDTALIITMIFLCLYTLLVGLLPSILRALFFFILIKINKILYLEIKAINLYLLTVSLILFIYPHYILNISFQYSALTCFGLIYSSELFKKGSYIMKMLKTSYIATLFSIVITINNFYEYNILSVFCNLIFIPLITIIVYPLSLIVFIIPLLEPLLRTAILITEKLSLITANIGIIISFPKINIILILVYYLILLLTIKYKFKLHILCLLILLISKYIYYFDNNYHIYYLDVGQGDCTVIRAPQNKEILMIDTGGKIEYEKEPWEQRTKNYNLSDNTITFLKSIGITKIDLLILTHGDKDHIGEYQNIQKNIRVNNIIINKGDLNYLESLISSKLINYNYASKYFEFYNYYPDILNNNENDNSIITYLKVYNYYFLFMGDAPKNVERKLLKDIDIKKIDFIKLGHHGSKTSTSEELLNKINPDYAIISSGRGNRYNHPSLEVTDLLNERKIKYFNTQDFGTIELVIRPNNLSIITYRP